MRDGKTGRQAESGVQASAKKTAAPKHTIPSMHDNEGEKSKRSILAMHDKEGEAMHAYADLEGLLDAFKLLGLREEEQGKKEENMGWREWSE
jgi:hypothetical protein